MLLLEALIKQVIKRFFDYLEMTPEEKEKKTRLLTESARKFKGKIKTRRFACTLAGIITTMLIAIAVSEPMAKLISHIFKGTSLASEAFFDFAPKAFALSLPFTAASVTLMLFVWLFGMDDKKREIRSPVKLFSQVTVVMCGISLASAILCAFSSGTLLPLQTQIATLIMPPTFIRAVAVVASYIMAVTVSIAELGIQAKIAYTGIKKWCNKANKHEE